MNRTKKIVKITLIVVASLIGTSVLFFAAMPYLSIFMGLRVHKKEMNNSIVNAGYPGWHEVTLDDHLQIKLPEAWTLVPGERITVIDENGEPVLAGVKIRSGSKESEQLTLGLLSECSGKRVSSYRMELAGYNMYLNFCETMWMWLDEQEKVTSVTVMHSDAELENIYYYFFCFYDTTGAYLTEAEAIAWSAKDR